MTRYSTEPKTRKYVKGHEFHLQEIFQTNMENNNWILLLKQRQMV